MNASPPLSSYQALISRLSDFIAPQRLITDPLRTLAYGTDASFYRLVPHIVVKAETEHEVRQTLAACHAHGLPVTFRAAGTSLSGQAVTDSVLLVLSDGWDGISVQDQGHTIRLQPGVIGADANRRLAAFARKIGPDPASIDSAKIGGIAANNSSGMCCGTSDNSYKTLVSMRLILADGAVLDTADPASVAAFRHSHADLVAALDRLGQSTRANGPLADRIRAKFAIKNTTGYGLNALVDFNDPIDILIHLMIGSEGTLGFISEITYRTVPDHAHKASALLLFADIGQACRAVAALKDAPVSAVELMDRPALRSVENKPGMPKEIMGVADGVAALLVETRAENPQALNGNIAAITTTLSSFATLQPASFTSDPDEFGKLWKIRKGLFPAVGAVRKPGTTVIIEDVAFKIADLAQATLDLHSLCAKHGYDEAIIFGHALDGNLHFVFTQDFGIDSEVARYAAFMDEVCHLVVDKYDGSLKAEHGTGRNMAPFVELEWGQDAFALMWQIKALLDPKNLLNPGVILDRDPHAHLKNLKPLPAADPLVDSCIECGFCERMCPSHGLTLSPRQRIVGWRQIARIEQAGQDASPLRTQYDYQGLQTCAACGLCATACPVGIETGLLTKAIRARTATPQMQTGGRWVARHFKTAMAATRLTLGAAGLVDKALGTGTAQAMGNAMHRLTGGLSPKVGASLPRAGHMAPTQNSGPNAQSVMDQVVYAPSCANRVFGTSTQDSETAPLPTIMISLLKKAGYDVVFPDNIDQLCCGQAFDSKGLTDQANAKSNEMEQALLAASDNGRLTVLMDASACTQRLKKVLDPRITVQDSVEFLHDHVMPRLRITPQSQPVLLHVNCAARRMGLDDKIMALAQACASQVIVPDGVGCCGFAGDKGFSHPELNDHALRKLAAQVPAQAEGGYSSNRTCEIGLSDHTGKPYRSIAYLLDRVSDPRF